MGVLSWLKSRKAEALCGVLLLLMAVNLVSVIWRKTITNDEAVLIPAAYYHLIAGQFHLVYEHPPLCKLLAGTSLLFLQPNEIKPGDVPTIGSAGDRAWAYEMRFWTDNGKSFETISFWTRVPMIALTIGLGILIFAFTRDLFGKGAALWAVALFVLEPTMLAHGRTVQTDIPAAFGFLFLFYTMHRYLRAPRAARAAWIGGAASVAMLAKFSMLLVGPIVAIFFAVRFLRKQKGVIAHLLVLGLTSLLLINAAYFFRHRPLETPEIEALQKFGNLRLALAAALHLLPTEFVLGVLWQASHSSEGHTAGLLGMYSKTGWWYYFPVAFALKTTLPFFFLSLAALGWGTWRMIAARDARFLWLVPPFLLYSLFLLFTGINIGVRYYLPGFALLFVLGGALLASLTSAKKLRRVGLVTAALLVGWCAFIAARVYPDYMSYMNAFASSHPQWWYLSDSNVEWGEDVRGLANYLHSHGEKSVRGAVLGAFLTMQFYDIDYIDALSDERLPDTRYLALGASFLNGSTVPEKPGRTEEERVNRFEEFRHRTPETLIGHSIYVFRMHD